MGCIATIAWFATCERQMFESHRLSACVYMGNLVVDVEFRLVVPYLGHG
jgi:hypothetical protein